MKILPPADTTEYPAYAAGYVQKAKYEDLINALQQQENTLLQYITTIPAQQADYRYAPGKWSIKEVLVHMGDAERIFAYRALCFARNDKTGLPGFDEEAYVPESNAAGRSLSQIAAEYHTIRQASISLFNSFTNEMLLRKGIANHQPVSVRGIGAIIFGHTEHHLQVLRERYFQ